MGTFVSGGICGSGAPLAFLSARPVRFGGYRLERSIDVGYPLGNPRWFPGLVLGRCPPHFDPAGDSALQNFPGVQLEQLRHPRERELTVGQKLECVHF